ncbi:MAG: PilZ domain-containing protein [Candidatus Omnitrophica bacterium]|nr:PilZ domain-containing protein [Candidatus Omnitrophota bacterium]MBU1925941.1 PilZ domain-containing protein [Candidatus Omnitrophota bacterium]MBU2063144.1 PilZ domain-containing protein [Candidatus Omnitrophota bacterium]
MQDRRQSKRMPMALFIRILVDEKDNMKCETFTQNVSADGAQILSSRPLTQNADVLLNIDVPNDPDIVRAEGTVRWVGKHALEDENGKKVFPIGVEFTYMDRQDRTFLEEYLYQNAD